MPAIAEINALVLRRRRELWEAEQVELDRAERAKFEQARKDGLLMDTCDIRAELVKVVKRMPETAGEARLKQLREQEARIETPAFNLTPEEILKRVKEERNDPQHIAEMESYETR